MVFPEKFNFNNSHLGAKQKEQEKEERVPLLKKGKSRKSRDELSLSRLKKRERGTSAAAQKRQKQKESRRTMVVSIKKEVRGTRGIHRTRTLRGEKDLRKILDHQRVNYFADKLAKG